MAFVPLGILLAIGVATVGQDHNPLRSGGTAPDPRLPLSLVGPARFGLAVLLALTASAGALTVRSDLRMGTIATTTGSGPWPPGFGGSPEGRAQTVRDTAALITAADGVLRASDRWVNITIGTGSLWPYAAGIALGLDERGVQSTVAPGSWTLYFGHERSPGRPVAATFELYAATDGAARQAARGAVLKVVDGAVLTYLRASP